MNQKAKQVQEKLKIWEKNSIDFNFWANKTLDQDPESGIRIRILIKIKPWMRIRIRIKAYADPKHCSKSNLSKEPEHIQTMKILFYSILIYLLPWSVGRFRTPRWSWSWRPPYVRGDAGSASRHAPPRPRAWCCAALQNPRRWEPDKKSHQNEFSNLLKNRFQTCTRIRSIKVYFLMKFWCLKYVKYHVKDPDIVQVSLWIINLKREANPTYVSFLTRIRDSFSIL